MILFTRKNIIADKSKEAEQALDKILYRVDRAESYNMDDLELRLLASN